MIETALTYSIIITGIHMCFREGMIFGWFAVMVDDLLTWLVGSGTSKTIQKPLWGCLTCMGGLWTIAITWSFHPLFILLVIGLNALIEKTFFADEP